MTSTVRLTIATPPLLTAEISTFPRTTPPSIADGEGGWSEPIPFDERVNTAGHELCPLVTLDGSAFLFTSNEDIRWVSSAIVEETLAEHASGPSE